MDGLNKVLLILHFVGLALGFSVSISNMVMLGLITKAAPSEKPVLSRFPPMMSKVGRIGLVLLWVTGLTMVYTKWGGFGVLPWQFHVKLTAVVLLSVTVGCIDVMERRVRKGDLSVAARIPTVGKIATTFALLALVFAVLAFE
jgi:uncharacterized membrane protein